MDDRKRTQWPWLVATVVAAPMLYVASFGPACWIAVRTGVDDDSVFAAAYWPIWWAIWRDVPVASPVLTIYAAVGLPKGQYLDVPTVDEGFAGMMIGTD